MPFYYIVPSPSTALEETIINRNDGAHFLWQLGPVFPKLVYTFQRGFFISNFFSLSKKKSGIAQMHVLPIFELMAAAS